MGVGDVTVSNTKNNSLKGAVFNGTNGLIAIPLTLSSWDTFTVNFWIYFNETPTADFERILTQYDETGNKQGILLFTGSAGGGDKDKIKFGAYLNNVKVGDIASAALTMGKWYNLTLEYSGSTASMYINKTLAGTDASSEIGLTITDLGLNLAAKDAVTNVSKVTLSNIQIFSRILTTEEREGLVDNKQVTKDLKHRWKLDNDFTDSIGSLDGVNTNTYLTIIDDAISTAVAAQRTDATDQWLCYKGLEGQGGTINIEN